MPLPKIDLPIYETIMPSTQQKIRYRPFTVKEEKNLLIAQETKDFDQIVLAIEQLLTNCLMDDVDVNTLSLFDIEYIILQIRARSVNNVIEFTIRDPDDDSIVELEMDIDKIAVTFPEVDNKVIKVSDDYMITMRYPSIKEMYMFKDMGKNKLIEQIFNLMISCIDNVSNGDQIYKLSDFSDKEVVEFVDDLPKNVIDKIKIFFEDMPKVVYNAEWTNSEGVEKTMPLEGLDNFFT